MFGVVSECFAGGLAADAAQGSGSLLTHLDGRIHLQGANEATGGTFLLAHSQRLGHRAPHTTVSLGPQRLQQRRCRTVAL